MLRTNLSTRPFYNERGIHAVLGLVAAIVLVLTIFNLTQIVLLSRKQSDLGSQAAAAESRARDLRAHAVSVRQSLNPRQLEAVASAATEANTLIGQRLFSWTDLLNRLETTSPDEAHIVAVRPKVDRQNGIVLTLNVLARDVDDVNQFMENLEVTGAFKNPRPTTERFNEQKLFESIIEANYLPETLRAAPEQPKAARQ